MIVRNTLMAGRHAGGKQQFPTITSGHWKVQYTIWVILAILCCVFCIIHYADTHKRPQSLILKYKNVKKENVKSKTVDSTENWVEKVLLSRPICTSPATLFGCYICDLRGSTEFQEQAVSQRLGSLDSSLINVDTGTESQQAFENVYEKKIWGEGGRGSGLGSTPENAEGVAYALRIILYKYGLISLLDAPCGALDWTQHFIQSIRKEIPCFQYIGVDIVRNVIIDNTKLFPNDTNVHFITADLSSRKTVLPRNQDLILSRDALQHLPLSLIASALQCYCESEAKFLLVGSYIGARKNKNKNIKVGMAFSINLLAPPFDFPQPLEFFNERTRDGKHLLLYNSTDLCNSKALKNFVDKFL